mmetsp:Transcript_95756/g.249484  ORF Transcript_95756/g.249484 Transcript_95756/m.249484 type:complete len:313 (+) Transcript_95756:298-1236(+)
MAAERLAGGRADRVQGGSVSRGDGVRALGDVEEGRRGEHEGMDGTNEQPRLQGQLPGPPEARRGGMLPGHLRREGQPGQGRRGPGQGGAGAAQQARRRVQGPGPLQHPSIRGDPRLQQPGAHRAERGARALPRQELHGKGFPAARRQQGARHPCAREGIEALRAGQQVGGELALQDSRRARLPAVRPLREAVCEGHALHLSGQRTLQPGTELGLLWVQEHLQGGAVRRRQRQGVATGHRRRRRRDRAQGGHPAARPRDDQPAVELQAGVQVDGPARRQRGHQGRQGGFHAGEAVRGDEQGLGRGGAELPRQG